MNLVDTIDFKELRSIELQVGPMCNMRCRHCQQMPDKSVALHFQYPTDDVMRFFDNFIKFSQQEKFIEKAKGSLEPMFRIMFYGGEALLYWKVWKDIVKHFTDKYNLLSNDVFRFVVTTNGTFIDESFVEFANKYELFVVFSYDAPHPFAVRDYVSDEVCERVNRIKKVKVLSSGSAYNCDPLLAYKCLQAKFPNAMYKPGMEINRTFAEMPEDTDRYDFDKLRLIVRKLVIGAKMKDAFCLHGIRNMLQAKINPATNFYHNTKTGICVSCKHIIAITPNGDVSFCYNTYDKLGTIRDDSMESIHEKAVAVWKKLYDPACDTCSGRDICYFGCARLLRDENNHAYNCENFRKPFYQILKEEVMRLGTPLTSEEISWYREQEKIMEHQVQEFLEEGKRKGK